VDESQFSPLFRSFFDNCSVFAKNSALAKPVQVQAINSSTDISPVGKVEGLGFSGWALSSSRSCWTVPDDNCSRDSGVIGAGRNHDALRRAEHLHDANRMPATRSSWEPGARSPY
jgi:hypothetical protein